MLGAAPDRPRYFALWRLAGRVARSPYSACPPARTSVCPATTRRACARAYAVRAYHDRWRTGTAGAPCWGDRRLPGTALASGGTGSDLESHVVIEVMLRTNPAPHREDMGRKRL